MSFHNFVTDLSLKLASKMKNVLNELTSLLVIRQMPDLTTKAVTAKLPAIDTDESRLVANSC